MPTLNPVYVHRLSFDKSTKKLDLKSELVHITDSIASDAATAAVVEKWTKIADKSFSDQGFNPDEVLMVVPEDQAWDGRESSVRHHQTNLGNMIGNSMMAVSKNADCAVLNSGSIRVDDLLSGNITQFDIIRTLPFGGSVNEIEVTGETLKRLLDIGVKNKGIGGYLQWGNIAQDTTAGVWKIDGENLKTTKRYTVAVTDFLMSGKESGFDWLLPTDPAILKTSKPDPNDASDLRNDIRQTWISYIQAQDTK